MNLRNMIFMRKMKGVSVLNTVEVPGVVPGDGGGAMEIDRVLALWGADSVYPRPATFRILANKIAEKTEALVSEPVPSMTGPGSHSHSVKCKGNQRDQLVAGTQSVAKRTDRAHNLSARGALRSLSARRSWLAWLIIT